MENKKLFCINVIAIVLFLPLLFMQCNSPQQKDKSISNSASVTDSCCKKPNQADSLKQHNANSLQSEITCPKCGNKKTETMPTDVCILSYTCQKCQAVLHPKEGDCCVFCTYGDHKCPSKQ